MYKSIFKKSVSIFVSMIFVVLSLSGCGENSSTIDGFDKYEMRDISSTELIAEMKTGWNLGNSFDAHEDFGPVTETRWGNPKTTKKMIKTIHEKGFNTIRIPTSWVNHLGDAPDYEINKKFLKRLEKVINFALDEGMYVILNTHHEESWRIPDYAHIDEANEKHQKLWAQIADYFKDYGDHLVFEGLNEPRIKGDELEWEGGSEENRECLDRLNKTFVDTVRASGGNNTTRLLLITTIGAVWKEVAIDNLAIPDDDHLGVSIHAYTPYSFTFDHENKSWEINSWDGDSIYEVKLLFSELKRAFLDKGIPVIITEYGAEDKEDNAAEVEKWVTDYLTLAKEYGIPCIWWDNGMFEYGTEHFAIFNRKKCTWYRENVVDAIMAVYE